jgi:hypothetical protein
MKARPTTATTKTRPTSTPRRRRGRPARGNEEGPLVIYLSSSAPAIPDSSVIASSSSSDTSVAAPPTESAALDEEQPAHGAHSPDVPVPNAPEVSKTHSASSVENSFTQRDPGDPRATGAGDFQGQADSYSSLETPTPMVELDPMVPTSTRQRRQGRQAHHEEGEADKRAARKGRPTSVPRGR